MNPPIASARSAATGNGHQDAASPVALAAPAIPAALPTGNAGNGTASPTPSPRPKRLSPRERRHTAAMVAAIAALHAGGFFLIAVGISQYHAAASHGHAETQLFGLGTGLLAYTLGLRHAFDADHISAIDNTTRKLMAERKRPLSVGFFFSLGHSSVVFIAALLIAFGVKAVSGQVSHHSSVIHQVGAVVGTSVSAAFLYVIAVLNLLVLISIWRLFKSMRKGAYDEAELERQLDQRGLMMRFFGRIARQIDSPLKMYPVGFLFGLGFDTASEVALLVLAGSATSSGLPLAATLSLPILFAAGMSLLDTLDGCFMNFAYGWAFARPVRKVYYNLTITGLSVGAAFLVGSVEVLGLLPSELHFKGAFWSLAEHFNLNTAGLAIVVLFAVVWTIALAIWHFGHVEEHFGLGNRSPEDGGQHGADDTALRSHRDPSSTRVELTAE